MTQPIRFLNRYKLRMVNGEDIIFEARPGDVMANDDGLRVWDGPHKSRFYPWATVLEQTCERVEWEAVS